jgi:hypothetical protein
VSVLVLMQFGHCELLLLEAGSSGKGAVGELRGRGTSAVGSRYQATTVEHRLKRINACCNEL